MKTIILSLAFVALVAVSAMSQECANGQCQRPLVNAVVSVNSAIVHAVPVMVHNTVQAVTHPIQTMQAVVCQQATPVHRHVRKRLLCRR